MGIRRIGGATIDAQGTLTNTNLLGVWLRAYEYDGIGRLVTILSSELSPSELSGPSVSSPPVKRVEQYLHDGEQRVAEVVGESITNFAPRTDREYVWNPYGVDEILCQLDAARVAWVVLTDRNNTPAALVSGNTGLVHEQYSVDPFGEVLAAEELRSGCTLLPSLKIGYQGLFAERFSETLTKFPLTAGARSIVHNRARTYVPYLGRFLQSDPLASGIALSNPDEPLGGYGSTPAALKINISPVMQYADGGNLYAAVGGNPVGRSDPRGLFWGAAIGAALSYAAPSPSDMTREVAKHLVTTYAAHQEYDLEWALDWDAGDDWHTRGDNSWVSQSFAIGMYESFDVHGYNPLDLAFAGKASGSRFTKATRSMYAGMLGQLHHIATFYGAWGVKFQKLFKRVGLELNDAVNAIPMPKHCGRHLNSYHDEVYRRLSKSVETAKAAGADEKIAFLTEMVKLRRDLATGTLKTN